MDKERAIDIVSKIVDAAEVYSSHRYAGAKVWSFDGNEETLEALKTLLEEVRKED